MAANALLGDIEQFLFHEAALLDRNRFDDWLALYTEDCRYWVPLEPGQIDGDETCSIIHDDHRLLEVRVRQWSHPRAHARLPLPRTVRQVGNVRLRAPEAAASADLPASARATVPGAISAPVRADSPVTASAAAAGSSDLPPLIVDSTLVLVEYRAERQRVFGAQVEHHLQNTSQGWQIRMKRVDLVNSEAALDGITIVF